jgi:hypothetical protein
MLDYVWSKRLLLISAALLFVGPFQPPRSLPGLGRQAVASREILWEFDTGG